MLQQTTFLGEEVAFVTSTGSVKIICTLYTKPLVLSSWESINEKIKLIEDTCFHGILVRELTTRNLGSNPLDLS